MRILTKKSTVVAAGSTTWQQQVKQAIRDPEHLVRALDLPPEVIDQTQACGPFPLFVPVPYLSRIERGNPNDPLLRQVLPVVDENRSVAGYHLDPLSESSFSAEPGLLRKYNGRALIIATGACAIHCRYCFRRHFPYQESAVFEDRWRTAIRSIASDDSIEEVILSGGDPLTLVDRQLSRLTHDLEQIPHLRRLRIHSRLPIVIPSRITSGLMAMLSRSRLKGVVVVHANHANEIDADVGRALLDLHCAGTIVLNQSVLLRGVNDDLDSLARLSERLIDCNVVPYYLHQLDPVSGAAHFHVPVEEGIQLIKQLRERLPGYMVPRYVQEIPGELHKRPLA
jgi:EF-P beta-lysylation protein EpmB